MEKTSRRTLGRIAKFSQCASLRGKSRGSGSVKANGALPPDLQDSLQMAQASGVILTCVQPLQFSFHPLCKARGRSTLLPKGKAGALGNALGNVLGNALLIGRCASPPCHHGTCAHSFTVDAGG